MDWGRGQWRVKGPRQMSTARVPRPLCVFPLATCCVDTKTAATVAQPIHRFPDYANCGKLNRTKPGQHEIPLPN